MEKSCKLDCFWHRHENNFVKHISYSLRKLLTWNNRTKRLFAYNTKLLATRKRTCILWRKYERQQLSGGGGELKAIN